MVSRSKSRTRKSGSMPSVGSRAQVWHGNANHTAGGLKKSDLIKNKHGRIVSKKASMRAKSAKNLGKCLVPKGSHKFIPGGKCTRKSTRKTAKAGRLTRLARNRAAGKGRPGDLTRALKKILM